MTECLYEYPITVCWMLFDWEGGTHGWQERWVIGYLLKFHLLVQDLRQPKKNKLPFFHHSLHHSFIPQHTLGSAGLARPWAIKTTIIPFFFTG